MLESLGKLLPVRLLDARRWADATCSLNFMYGMEVEQLRSLERLCGGADRPLAGTLADG